MTRAPLIALVLLAGCGAPERAVVPGSTLRATLVDRDGDGRLEPGPAEPLRDRGGSGDPGRVLATFAQITDAHLRDEESPARPPFLDRYGDPFESTFRPHEALTPHLLAAATRALNRERPGAVFVTGDLIDNAQANELEQARAVLDGGTVRPDTGARGYRGVQEEGNPDPLYYRPDLDAPRHPGLLDEAQRPFRAPGLDTPWHFLPGNHDATVAGEVPWDPRLEAIARGGELVASLDPRFEPSQADRADPLTSLTAATGRQLGVPADPGRRPADLPAPVPSVQVGAMTAVLLDTNRPVDPDRLRARLTGERVVVLSHHPLEEDALRVLDGAPNVVAAISGHRHRNRIERRGHFWLVSTASLVDFPQQVRMFRLRERALETWVVDHDGRGLAGTARELAFLDAQGGRPQGFAGTRLDRNVRLF